MAGQPPGRRLLLTGATSGLGPELARALHVAGYHVLLSGRRAEPLAALRRELYGSETILADLTRPDDVAELGQRAAGVEVLVANAGVGSAGPLLKMTVERIDETIAVNLRAPLVLTRLLLPGMIVSGRGQVVLMASMAGQVPGPGQVIYGPTKAGLRAFGFALRNELRGAGVGVSLVSPYYIGDVGMFARRGARTRGQVSPRQVTDAVLRAIEHNPPEITVGPLPLRLGRRIPGAFPEVMARVPLRHPES